MRYTKKTRVACGVRMNRLGRGQERTFMPLVSPVHVPTSTYICVRLHTVTHLCVALRPCLLETRGAPVPQWLSALMGSFASTVEFDALCLR